MAIGQLLDYEYFQVKQRPGYSGKEISKGIVYSKKPDNFIINFLLYNNLYVFWIEDGQLTGEVSSMRKLNDLLA
ncbi:MAG: hypothetical protein QXW80_06960 [Candidatus Micrarchaeia archaeon]|uniref:hypothetical protein n=1 Tax=Saccharolobus sp. TaxID=2100761 RepID=UPI00316B7D8B